MAYKNIEDKKANALKYRINNKEKINAANKARRRKLKSMVLDQYGSVCQLCGFEDIRALQIDHINNNGAAERKALGGQNVSGWRFYEHLWKTGFPAGYQTLCANCNMIKQLGENF